MDLLNDIYAMSLSKVPIFAEFTIHAGFIVCCVIKLV